MEPRLIGKIIGKIISFELATSYTPRLCLHRYFNWTVKNIKTKEDWNTSMHVPTKLKDDLKRALEFIEKFF